MDIHTRPIARHARLGCAAIAVLMVAYVSATPAASATDAKAAMLPVSYTPLPSARVLDTRVGGITIDSIGTGGGPIGSAGTVRVPLAGRAGVPRSGVAAVALNVTVVGQTLPTYVTVYPADAAQRPMASNLDPMPGITAVNAVISTVSSDGAVVLFNAFGSVQLIVDVEGWFPTGGGYAALQPARLVDTRAGNTTIDGVDAGAGAFGSAETRQIHITGRGGVQATGVDSVVLSVTAVDQDEPTYLAVFPADAPRPPTSNVNPQPGIAATNMVITKLSPTGDIDIYNNSGHVNVIVDVLGSFGAQDSGYTAIQPKRLLDTRGTNGYRFGKRVGDQTTGTLEATGPSIGIPKTGVSAVVLNITALDDVQPTFITVWPYGSDTPYPNPAPPRPNTSNLNPEPGIVSTNTVIVGVGALGWVNVYNNIGRVNVVVDIVGWFSDGHIPYEGINWPSPGLGGLAGVDNDNPVRDLKVMLVTDTPVKIGDSPLTLRLAEPDEIPFLVRVTTYQPKYLPRDRWIPLPVDFDFVGNPPADARVYFEINYTEFAPKISDFPIKQHPDYIIGTTLDLNGP